MAKTPRPLTPDEAGSRLRARFGSDVVDVTEQYGHAVATVTRDRYHDVCRYLREEPEFEQAPNEITYLGSGICS